MKVGVLSIRKKTIGEVLRLARISQGLSLEELQRKTDIQLDLLEALETDNFDKLPVWSSIGEISLNISRIPSSKNHW